MESIEFISNYQKYLQEILDVVHPNLSHIVIGLSKIDPHDLIQPDTYFISPSHARGFVWSMFLHRINTKF